MYKKKQTKKQKRKSYNVCMYKRQPSEFGLLLSERSKKNTEWKFIFGCCSIFVCLFTCKTLL